MKTTAEGIDGSHVMEKCQRLSGHPGIRMPLQHQLLLFPQPQLEAAAARPLGLGLTSIFPVLLVFLGKRGIASYLGKNQRQWQHYLLC